MNEKLLKNLENEVKILNASFENLMKNLREKYVSPENLELVEELFSEIDNLKESFDNVNSELGDWEDDWEDIGVTDDHF